jgi:hypothetical protein
MKNFVVQSGNFITTSGIYRMNDHPGREITLIYGDAVPMCPGKKVKFRLIREMPRSLIVWLHLRAIQR